MDIGMTMLNALTDADDTASRLEDTDQFYCRLDNLSYRDQVLL
jgi:hypothetical protein